MSSIAKSIYYFGLYLLAAGLGLFLFPNQVISLLGLPTTTEVWINLVGILTFILGVFFCYTAKHEAHPFFFISMFGRGIFITGILILILFRSAPVQLLLFASVDFVGLLWTLYTYRHNRSVPTIKAL